MFLIKFIYAKGDWGCEEDNGPLLTLKRSLLLQLHQLHSLISSESRTPVLPFQLFFKAMANICRTIISTVPFPTSKCLLLPFLQLSCLLLLSAEATAHIWQQLSGCAEKHLLFQITTLIQEDQRHLVISCKSQHGDRKRGRERLWNHLNTAGWHLRNEDVEIGKREHIIHTAENLGVQKGREVCVYLGTLPIWLSFM